ncbi:MAG: aminotransferase class III-fold pyridoxal phosphate-dependent enzyme, partial [Aeoliella sp.]
YPIGAFGARREIMDLVREDRMGQPDYMWVASTLGGNPISMAAACAALEVFAGEGVYEHLHSLGRYVREGMQRVLADAHVTSQVIGDGPLAQVVFSDQPVHDYRSTKAGDGARGRELALELFRRGVFLNPMGTKLYISLAHDEAICDEFLEIFAESLVATG